MVDWSVSSVKACVTEYLRKDDDDKDDDDNDANSKDIEVVEIGIGEALIILDRLVKLKDLRKEERNSLVVMKDKLECWDKIRVLNKKQSHINDHISDPDVFQ